MVDPRWLDQLVDLGIDPPYAELDLTAWATGQRVGRYLTLRHALAPWPASCRRCPGLARLFPAPGTTVRRASGDRPAVPANAKMLSRIRALLAKAEATEFPDEAEALVGQGAGADGEVHASTERWSRPIPGSRYRTTRPPGGSGWTRRMCRRRPSWSARSPRRTAAARSGRGARRGHVIGADLDLQLTEILGDFAAGAGESRDDCRRQTHWPVRRVADEVVPPVVPDGLRAADRRAAPGDDRVDAGRRTGRGCGSVAAGADAARGAGRGVVHQAVSRTRSTRRTRITNGAGWAAGLSAADQAQLRGPSAGPSLMPRSSRPASKALCSRARPAGERRTAGSRRASSGEAGPPASRRTTFVQHNVTYTTGSESPRDPRRAVGPVHVTASGGSSPRSCDRSRGGLRPVETFELDARAGDLRAARCAALVLHARAAHGLQLSW